MMCDDELLTLDSVALQLKVSVETARKLCVKGRLPWVPVGTGESRHLRRVRQSTLDAYVRNERRQETRTEVRQITQAVSRTKTSSERW
jgi:hypothetical protein